MGGPGDYGATQGPQDGQQGPIRPIEVPSPAPQPPAYPPSGAYAAAPRTNWLGGLTAASGMIAMLLFFICGLAFDGWGWSWLFFFLPGLVAAFARGAVR